MISVALCTYNGEKYIYEQLKSIIDQTLPPDEIVICDDCSSDHTVDIIQEISSMWKGKLNLFVNPNNIGLKKNFVKAVSLCTGDIIFLCDQDDVWDLKKLQTVMEIFNKNKEAVMVFHDAEIVDENLKLLHPSLWRCWGFDSSNFIESHYIHLSYGNVIQGCACAFKKCLFNYSLPFPNNAFHDEWLGLSAITLGKVIPLSDCLLKYRQSSNNVLGAGAVSLKTKVYQWIVNFNAKIEQKREYLTRRLNVMSCFKQRYLGFADNKEMKTFFSGAYEFLKMRENCVNTGKIHLIRCFPLYFRFIPTRYTFCLREFIIDVVIIIFGKHL